MVGWWRTLCWKELPRYHPLPMRTGDGVSLVIEIKDDIAQRIASPAFQAINDQWNDDYTERLIRVADLKGIGMTDD